MGYTYQGPSFRFGYLGFGELTRSSSRQRWISPVGDMIGHRLNPCAQMEYCPMTKQKQLFRTWTVMLLPPT